MMFVALLKTRGNNTFQEGVARRMQWDYPEGVRVLGEYWLETESPRVVSVMEADGMEAFGQIRMHWNDMFHRGARKGDSWKFATPSNSLATPKIRALGDTPEEAS